MQYNYEYCMNQIWPYVICSSLLNSLPASQPDCICTSHWVWLAVAFWSLPVVLCELRRQQPTVAHCTACTWAYMVVCVYTCRFVCVHAYPLRQRQAHGWWAAVRPLAQLYMYVYICTHTHIYIYTHTYICTHIYMYICMGVYVCSPCMYVHVCTFSMMQ